MSAGLAAFQAEVVVISLRLLVELLQLAATTNFTHLLPLEVFKLQKLERMQT
jgi:hypothetical protein